MGVPFAFMGSAAAAYWQIWRLWLAGLKFRNVDVSAVKPRTIHRFSTDFDVEVASRVGRVWDEDFNLDQRAVDIAENVLKVRSAIKAAMGCGRHMLLRSHGTGGTCSEVHQRHTMLLRCAMQDRGCHCCQGTCKHSPCIVAENHTTINKVARHAERTYSTKLVITHA